MRRVTQVERLQEMINGSDRIVFFGGAGTSTDCGLPDFRGSRGIYQTKGLREKYGHNPEDILSRDFFEKHTEEFFDFYRNEMIFDWAQPNIFHKKLVQLEQTGKLAAIVTQNTDGLHQKAGSRNVIELHGSSARNICDGCGQVYSETWMKSSTGIPRCEACGGVVVPDVILYGDSLDADVLNTAKNHIHKADMLIIAGTSLNVEPAASLIRNSFFAGEYIVIINKEATKQDHIADLVIHDSVTGVFNQLNCLYK